MSSHAYLILAHDNFYVLEKLLRLVDDPRNSIHIHIDKKVAKFDPDALARLCRHAPVTFIPRVPVYWGDYSQLEATFRLFESAAPGKHDYYHLLSGADLPLQSQDNIHDFCSRNAGKEFVGFAREFDPRWVTEIQLLTRHLRPRSKVTGLFRRTAAQNFIRLQRLFKYDRSRKFGLILKKGSDWYSITHALAEHFLANEKTGRELLKHGLVPAEFYLQTLVWNSDFRERVYDIADEYASNMRLIDWNRGEPYVFRSKDFDELIGCGRLFARKFQETVDRDVVDRIYAHLVGSQDRGHHPA
jgi:hypothetical protein